MKKMLNVFSIPVFLFFLSCGNKAANQKNIENEFPIEQQTDTLLTQLSQNEKGIEQQADMILTDDEVIYYFQTFREFLLKGKIDELADLVHFPVEGDYHYEWILNEKGERVRDFNPYRKKEDFIENYSKFFGKDLKNLFKKVDFRKSLQEDYPVVMNKKPTMEAILRIYYHNKNPFGQEPEQKPTQVILSLNYEPTNDDIGGGGIIYRFEKIEGKIKLIAIQFVGGIGDEHFQ